ncbi:SDR family NAD(P)-dependent oxidoreductase [Actinophytocola sp.]|uniref:SDR family NAD(P)-dependent oxidoreductase n=1 Tax=Actinophytocola sp. TaxID=1872138 RepID=UPI00389A28B2
MAKTVLITGATAGLGRATAIELHRRGWTVLAHGRSEAKLAGLPGVTPLLADLASLAEVRSLAERVTHVDVLVNNAAVGFGPPGGAREVSVDGHELRMAVNYLAPVLLTRLLLRTAAPARVVNVGSLGQVPFDPADIEFTRGYDGVLAYRRSKLALVAHTFDLAEELRGRGVTVNCVHPAGFMDTAMVRESGITPMSTVDEGLAAVLASITGPADDTGQFYAGTRRATALAPAYDPGFRRDLREVTERMLTTRAGRGTE